MLEEEEATMIPQPTSTLEDLRGFVSFVVYNYCLPHDAVILDQYPRPDGTEIRITADGEPRTSVLGRKERTGGAVIVNLKHAKGRFRGGKDVAFTHTELARSRNVDMAVQMIRERINEALTEREMERKREERDEP